MREIGKPCLSARVHKESIEWINWLSEDIMTDTGMSQLIPSQKKA